MKRGQQTGTAAGLVATITGLIILYILFLPPEDRAELLGEEIPSSGDSSPSTIHDDVPTITDKTIFSVSPGMIRYQSLDEFEYDLPAFTLVKTTEARVLDTINNFRIRNGWFDKVSKNMTFYATSPETTDNVLLSFNTKRHKGVLTIRLNGRGIFEYDIDTVSPSPVALRGHDLVPGENVLEFSVSGVGAKFWTTNEYSFSDIKITGDISDTSRQESKNTFYISPEEGSSAEKAVLKFNPECSPPSVGMLDVQINGRSVFSGIPDCGILNTYSISPSMLNIGRNSVTFRTERGSYLIDQIQVKTFLSEPVQPTYYFEMDDEYFVHVGDFEERCGDIDGICPNDCSEDSDWDCCFEENPNGFWCDLPTRFVGDRCVGFVDENECGRCQSGYEDEDGELSEYCDDHTPCGDDTDDECPEGCNPRYDKDCCFDLPGDQYWCDDLPTTGETFICMQELTRSNCQYCLSEYEAEEDDFECEYEHDTEAELKKGLDVLLIFRFTESRDNKEAEVWINGKQTGFDTRESSYRKNINDFVEPDTNSIRIRPRTDLDIRELEVKFD